MSLSDFTPDEDLALLGLMRAVVKADGDYSPEEQREIAALREEMGEDRFDTAIEAAKTRFESLKLLKEHAATITRKEAQTVILRKLVGLAVSDRVTEDEEKPLRWLARTWPEADLSG